MRQDDEDTQRIRRPLTELEIQRRRVKAAMGDGFFTYEELEATRARVLTPTKHRMRFKVSLRYLAVQWLFFILMSLALYYGRPVFAILAGLVSFVAFYGGLEYAATTEDS